MHLHPVWPPRDTPGPSSAERVLLAETDDLNAASPLISRRGRLALLFGDLGADIPHGVSLAPIAPAPVYPASAHLAPGAWQAPWSDRHPSTHRSAPATSLLRRAAPPRRSARRTGRVCASAHRADARSHSPFADQPRTVRRAGRQLPGLVSRDQFLNLLAVQLPGGARHPASPGRTKWPRRLGKPPEQRLQLADLVLCVVVGPRYLHHRS
jgi:hypothetical protein